MRKPKFLRPGRGPSPSAPPAPPAYPPPAPPPYASPSPRPRTRSGVTDTGLRFALLMVLVAASSISMLDRVLAPTPNDTSGDALGCLLAAGIDPNASYLDNLALGARHAALLDACMSGVPEIENIKGLIGTAVLLAVAAALYWWLPLRRDRKGRTVPVEAVSSRNPGLIEELAALRAHAGIDPRVRFRIDPTRTTTGAVVYGRAGRHTVCLHLGLLARRTTDPEGFRAVVLHELAHIRNRDVDFAHGSTALWRVFVALALLPYLFNQLRIIADGLFGTSSPFWPGAASIITYAVLSGLLLVALVHLARADLLRRRELHADAQAAAWGAHPGGWDHTDPYDAHSRSPRLRRIAALLRTHPGWGERRRVLADPGWMSTVGTLEMFLTGVAASLLVNELLVVPGFSGGNVGALFTALLVAPVLFLVLTRSVADAARSGGRRTESGVRSGLWLGAGLMVGVVVRGGHSGNDWLVNQPVYLLALPVIALVPAVWSAQFARLCLILSGRSVRIAVAVLNLLVTLALLWGGLRWWQSSGSSLAMGVAAYDGVIADQIQEIIPGPWEDFPRELSVIAALSPVLMLLRTEVLFGAAALLMSFVPLTVHVYARRTGLRLRRTLAAGAVGGLLSWAGLALAAQHLNTRRPELFAYRAGLYSYVHLWWQIAVVLTACLLTAALVAAFSRRHWLLRSLLAVQTVLFLAYAAVFAMAAGDGCIGPMNKLGDRCHWIPANGRRFAELVAADSLISTTLLATCAALAGAAAGQAVRRRRAVTGAGSPEDRLAAPRLPGSGSRRPWPAMLWRSTVLLLAVPVSLLTVTAQMDRAGSTPHSDETRRNTAELFDASPSAQVEKIREWQARAWISKGGLDHIKGLSVSFGALSKSLMAAAAQKPGPNGKVRIDNEEFSRLCRAIGDRATDAENYFPVPFRELQRPWSKALSEIKIHSRTCQDALREGGDSPIPEADRPRRFQESLDALITSMRPLLDTLAKLSETAALPKPKP